MAAEGYTALAEPDHWDLQPGGKYYLTRNQSAIWPFAFPARQPDRFILAASHSDRPCFKVKENPELETEYIRLAVERYGSMLMSTWLDRPLSIAGRVLVETAEGITARLVNLDRDLLSSQPGHSHEPEGQRRVCLQPGSGSDSSDRLPGNQGLVFPAGGRGSRMPA